LFHSHAESVCLDSVDNDGNTACQCDGLGVRGPKRSGANDFVAWVAYSGEEYTIGSGRIKVETDLRGVSASAALDIRSPARKILEKLEVAMQARDPSLASYSIQTGNGSRTKQFTTLAEVRIEYEHVRAEVAREDQAASIAAGNGNPRKLFVRFGRA
jgi:hypothetical protein